MMQWEEFLNTPEIESEIRQNPGQTQDDLGDYLYKKMLHDMLECLNGHKDNIEVAHIVGNIPHDVQQWASKWNPSIQAWIAKLTDISRNYYQKKVVPSEIDWPTLLNELASIPTEIALQDKEAQKLTIPQSEPLQSIIRGAVRSITQLKLICHYIEQQDYMSLWITNDKRFDTYDP